jgi:phage terminase large subunit-like protein
MLDMRSAAERLAALPEAQRDVVLSRFSEQDCEDLLCDWRGFRARPNQIAPDGDWDIWMVMAGRGFGKTRTGAEWVREQVCAGVGRIALIGETAADTRDVMVEGESGLLSVYPKDERPLYEPSKRQVTWSNGAIAKLYNATEPDQLRGPQHAIAWCDELAKWRYARETWDQLQFGLRLGDHPRQIVTTTPRPIALVKAIVAGHEGRVHVTRGRTLDNRSNLAPTFLSKIEARYADTRLGRQELEGEILGDLPGALWRQDQIDIYRLGAPPENLGRIVVSVDPAVTHTDQSDEHGLVVAGIAKDNKGQQTGYVLEDASVRGSPLIWARRAIALHDKYAADGIVVEVNQGGDMVANTLRSVREGLNIIEVRATRGKHVRAEPIAALYEQGRVHHVGAFCELENQMTMITNAGFEGEGSPDRLDALVWALTELFPEMVQTAPTKIPEFKVRRVV